MHLPQQALNANEDGRKHNCLSNLATVQMGPQLAPELQESDHQVASPGMVALLLLKTSASCSIAHSTPFASSYTSCHVSSPLTEWLCVFTAETAAGTPHTVSVSHGQVCWHVGHSRKRCAIIQVADNSIAGKSSHAQGLESLLVQLFTASQGRWVGKEGRSCHVHDRQVDRWRKGCEQHTVEAQPDWPPVRANYGLWKAL